MSEKKTNITEFNGKFKRAKEEGRITMTVKDYLKVHSGDDIKSVGIYKADKEQDIIDAHVKTVDLVKYEDLEVDYVHLFVYDESDVDIQGNPINLKHIRACIYVR